MKVYTPVYTYTLDNILTIVTVKKVYSIIIGTPDHYDLAVSVLYNTLCPTQPTV
jgi:hypothetical protein